MEAGHQRSECASTSHVAAVCDLSGLVPIRPTGVRTYTYASHLWAVWQPMRACRCSLGPDRSLRDDCRVSRQCSSRQLAGQWPCLVLAEFPYHLTRIAGRVASAPYPADEAEQNACASTNFFFTKTTKLSAAYFLLIWVEKVCNYTKDLYRK